MRWYTVLLLLLVLQPVLAEDYSFERAESLKPLIKWRDYGPDAFTEAIDANKPIFLLLTAPSWCHWCQVYESEEYLFHPDVIAVINEQYIPVYVDADQRQDLTRQYLEGGWPSTTVFTPGRERLFGFSGPRPVPWLTANLKNAATFVGQQGHASNIQYTYEKKTARVPSAQELQNMVNTYVGTILGTHDPEYGGFGQGQKFPQGRSLDFALDMYERTKEPRLLELVEVTLEHQYTDDVVNDYNLYDPVEGGFHRYGTQRDWTPPHYEKMLYDNARLLKTYAHFTQLTESEVADEVVANTDAFLQSWFDGTGFYGNSDAYTEGEYFDTWDREGNVRVERTKYTDWNAEAIQTYLYLWRTKQVLLDMRPVLAFYTNEMNTDEGVYHYRTPDGEKGVRGVLVDTAQMLLTFVDAYATYNDPAYLATAQELAEYALAQLYDWHGGGFFDRHSPDLDLYAPGEHIKLDKPMEANGVMAYALLQLYTHTQEQMYLSAGLKTLGAVPFGGLDPAYYGTKAAEYALVHNLVHVFDPHAVAAYEAEQQEAFWLDALLEGRFVQTEQTAVQPSVFLLLLALLAGVLSFVSPCTLPILPAYVAYMVQAKQQRMVATTLAFFLGLSLTFTVLGMTATSFGLFLRGHLTVFSQVAGALVVLFGLMVLFGKGLPGVQIQTKRTSAFFFGVALGLSWTPCVGPILVAILVLAATASSVWFGGILLFMYALGLAVPLVLVSLYLSRLNKKSVLWKWMKGKELHLGSWTVHSTSLLTGLLLLVLGVLIFTGTLYTMNQYIATTPVQQWLYALEELLLRAIP